MNIPKSFALALLLPFLLIGCSDSSVDPDEPMPDGDGSVDATAGDDGHAADANGDQGDPGIDAGTDAGVPDATNDAGDPDIDGGDQELDAGGDPGHDAGDPDISDGEDAYDAGDPEFDAGSDPGYDAGSDSGYDAGSDSGYDAGSDDGGGDPGGDGAASEIWVEIDYSDAYTPQSPDWSFSDTPGWGPAQWAMAGETWPEAWDRWNNMSVVSDPIGTVLEIGSGSELQLMIGLEELISYDSAMVRLEGRSRSSTSGVQFDVYNPWNNCGTDSYLPHNWDIHVVELDLDQCLVPGQGVQAVRVDPTQGTIALVRMRVTIYNPVW